LFLFYLHNGAIALTQERKTLGALGEAEAVRHLKKKGYRILQTNFRVAVGEIDVIAEQGNALVFIEVKTRSSARFGGALVAVNIHKQRKIIMVAESFLARYKVTGRDIRFDVVTVEGKPGDWKVQIVENAFRA